MLNRFVTFLIATATVVTNFSLMHVAQAFADDPVVACPKGQVRDPETGKCTFDLFIPGSPGGSPGSPGGSVPVGQPVVPAPSQPEVCVQPWRNEVVPCEHPVYGWWNHERSCYVKPASPQPGFDDPIWQGRNTGAIYTCTFRIDFTGGQTRFWVDDQPGGVKAPPNPAAIARRLRSEIEFKAFTPATSIPNSPDAMGIVGVPIGLWATNPDAQTFGPITRSATEANITVTLTAKVERVVWNLGNNDTVVCTTPGTAWPYPPNVGLADIKPSPDCGYTYTKQGRYPVTASIYWNLSWTTNTGIKGVLAIEPFTVPVQTIPIAEIQVVHR